MISSGLEEEARKPYHPKHLNALNTVGYKEFFEYFDGTISREKAIELIKRNTRRYAKRQMTWWAKDKYQVVSSGRSPGDNTVCGEMSGGLRSRSLSLAV